MTLDYLVCYDRQNPTAWVKYDNPAPLTGQSTGSIPLTDDPEIAAATETLLALVAAKQGLTRAEPPAPVVSTVPVVPASLI